MTYDGFVEKEYDSSILYENIEKLTEEELFNLSQKIIFEECGKFKTAFDLKL